MDIIFNTALKLAKLKSWAVVNMRENGNSATTLRQHQRQVTKLTESFSINVEHWLGFTEDSLGTGTIILSYALRVNMIWSSDLKWENQDEGKRDKNNPIFVYKIYLNYYFSFINKHTMTFLTNLIRLKKICLSVTGFLNMFSWSLVE